MQREYNILMLFVMRSIHVNRWRAGKAMLLLVCCGWLYYQYVPATPPKTYSENEPLEKTNEIKLLEDQLLADAQRFPSLPFAYYYKRHYGSFKYYKSTCAPFPSVYDLEYSNLYWQTLRSRRGVFLLYGAYLDARNASPVGPALRLLAVHDRVKPRPTHCQIWFEERPEPVFNRVLEYKYIGEELNSTNGLQPYLLTCVLPPEVRTLRPAAVSLVEQPCDRATNCLHVHFDLPERTQKEFAVCVNGLDFQHENAVRLVEWIELLRLLGADKVFFYELQVHPNISRVLAYYGARGIVVSTPITLPGGQPNQPLLRRMYLKKKINKHVELVPYNDCLYRHMYKYRWLVILDVEEVIVPLQDSDWSSLLERVMRLAGPKPRSYLASNVFDLNERTQNMSVPGGYVKAFHDTARVLVAHNRFPLACFDGVCSSYVIDTRVARLEHYRDYCTTGSLGYDLAECLQLRMEPAGEAALWRLADRLVPRVRHALAELGLLPPPSSTNHPQALSPHGACSSVT